MKTIKESLQEYIGDTHYPYWLLVIQMSFFSVGLGLNNAKFMIFTFLLVPSFYVLSELIYDVKTNIKEIERSFCGNTHYPRILSVFVWFVIAYGFSFLHIDLAMYTIIASPFLRVFFEVIYFVQEKRKNKRRLN